MSDIKEETPRTRTFSVFGLWGRVALGVVVGLVVLLALAWLLTGPARAERQAVADQSAAVATAAAEASKSAEVWLAEQNASASAKSAASASRSQEAEASKSAEAKKAEASRAAETKKAAAKSAAEQAVKASIIAKNPKGYVSTVEATQDPSDGNWIVKISYTVEVFGDARTESHRVSVGDDMKAKVLS